MPRDTNQTTRTSPPAATTAAEAKTKTEVEGNNDGTATFAQSHRGRAYRRGRAEIDRGIIIPDSAKEKPQEATVIAVGPGKLDKEGARQPLDVQVGDRVLIGKYAGNDVKIGDKDYVILTEDEVLAVVEGAVAEKAA